MVRTLTQAEDVATVRMMLGSEALTDAAGNAVAVMSADSFVDDGGEGNVVELQLYFANQKGDRLVGSRRNVVCDSNTSMERLVVEQLIEGPGTPEARASIPAQTRILSVSLSDGICYVDLDSAFLEGDGSLTPQVSIYSIVNSLSELGNVHRVRIMINGKSNIMYREVMDLEESYIRNLDMIE